MVLHSSTVRYPPSSHHGLSPTSQWTCGKISPAVKTALITRLTGANWVDELPWVLLSICTTSKEDINCSTAKLVYGSPLAVPGDFIPGTNELQNPSSLLPWLRQAISKFNFTPMSQHGVAPQHIASPYVFIRRDSHRPPLTPPYRGRIKSCNAEPSLFRLMLAAGKKLFLWIASSLLLWTRHFRSNSASQETRKTLKS